MEVLVTHHYTSTLVEYIGQSPQRGRLRAAYRTTLSHKNKKEKTLLNTKALKYIIANRGTPR